MPARTYYHQHSTPQSTVSRLDEVRFSHRDVSWAISGWSEHGMAKPGQPKKNEDRIGYSGDGKIVCVVDGATPIGPLAELPLFKHRPAHLASQVVRRFIESRNSEEIPLASELLRQANEKLYGVLKKAEALGTVFPSYFEGPSCAATALLLQPDRGTASVATAADCITLGLNRAGEWKQFGEDLLYPARGKLERYRAELKAQGGNDEQLAYLDTSSGKRGWLYQHISVINGEKAFGQEKAHLVQQANDIPLRDYSHFLSISDGALWPGIPTDKAYVHAAQQMERCGFDGQLFVNSLREAQLASGASKADDCSVVLVTVAKSPSLSSI